MHTLRAAPRSGHAALQKLNDLLRECVCTITNTDLADVQWLQARLAHTTRTSALLGAVDLRLNKMVWPLYTSLS